MVGLNAKVAKRGPDAGACDPLAAAPRGAGTPHPAPGRKLA